MSNPGRKPGFHTKWLKCGLTLVSLRRFYFHYFILTNYLIMTIASKSSSSFYTLKNPHKIMNAVVLIHIFTTFTPLPPTNSPLASLAFAFLGDKKNELTECFVCFTASLHQLRHSHHHPHLYHSTTKKLWVLTLDLTWCLMFECFYLVLWQLVRNLASCLFWHNTFSTIIISPREKI